jgi:hypothetical protein
MQETSCCAPSVRVSPLRLPQLVQHVAEQGAQGLQPHLQGGQVRVLVEDVVEAAVGAAQVVSCLLDEVGDLADGPARTDHVIESESMSEDKPKLRREALIPRSDPQPVYAVTMEHVDEHECHLFGRFCPFCKLQRAIDRWLW